MIITLRLAATACVYTYYRTRQSALLHTVYELLKRDTLQQLYCRLCGGRTEVD